MPTTPTPPMDELLIDFPQFMAVFEPWEVETVDALLAGLRARGFRPTLLQTFPEPNGRSVCITYYVGVADSVQCRQRHLSMTLA